MDEIQTEFDDDLKTFVVTLPELVTLEALQSWEQVFLQKLELRPDGAGLLFDSNNHNFQSTECLKWLKCFFVERARLGSQITRVAFVQPVQYRPPQFVSDMEAYFENAQEARRWLRQAPRSAF